MEWIARLWQGFVRWGLLPIALFLLASVYLPRHAAEIVTTGMMVADPDFVGHDLLQVSWKGASATSAVSYRITVVNTGHQPIREGDVNRPLVWRFRAPTILAHVTLVPPASGEAPPRFSHTRGSLSVSSFGLDPGHSFTLELLILNTRTTGMGCVASLDGYIHQIGNASSLVVDGNERTRRQANFATPVYIADRVIVWVFIVLVSLNLVRTARTMKATKDRYEKKYDELHDGYEKKYEGMEALYQALLGRVEERSRRYEALQKAVVARYPGEFAELEEGPEEPTGIPKEPAQEEPVCDDAPTAAESPS